jgi:hypothetical protein
MKTLLNSKVLSNLLWMVFGTMSVLIYYPKQEYWIAGLMAIIATLYAIKLVKSIKINAEDTL